MIDEQVGAGNSYVWNICLFTETHLHTGRTKLSIYLPGGGQTHMIQFQTGVVQACWNNPLSGLVAFFFFCCTFKIRQRVTPRWLWNLPYKLAPFIQDPQERIQKIWICLLCRQFPIRAGNSRICPKGIYMAIPLLWIPLHNPAWDQLGVVTALSLWSCKSRN